MNILSLESPTRSQEFLDAFHYGQRGTAARIQLGRLDFLHRDEKYQESIKIAHAFADYYVDKALKYRNIHLTSASTQSEDLAKKEGTHKYVLLNEMALETDKQVLLRSQVMNVFLAGHESSAIAIGNAVFQLCRHPEIWERLRAEVLAQDGSPLTVDTLKSMTYLQNIIKESELPIPYCECLNQICPKSLITIISSSSTISCC